MVSLWPWNRDVSSPASFEKALSRLSEQISRSTIRLDRQRTRSRRVKALWTLYTSIAYLVYTLILTLVLGFKRWNVAHYGGIVASPLVIYAVRKGATLFYDWRISSEQAYLEELQKQRDTTIEKLKSATKYNSTQQLLEKYGGSTPKSTPKGKSTTQSKKGTPTSGQKIQQQQPGPRTGIAPPTTANIPGRNAPTTQSPLTPQRRLESGQGPSPPNVPFTPDEPGFAPNAYPSNSQQMQQSSHFQPQSPHWYDRLFDVLLGEDENLPKNRLALICSQCRLVNGQAPPGIKSLDDVGRWRCGACGAWNGEESETKRVLEAVRQKEEKDRKEGWEVVSRGDEDRPKAEIKDSPVSTRQTPASRRKEVIPSSEDEGEDDDEEQELSEETAGSRMNVEEEAGPDDHEGSGPRRRVTRGSKKRDDDLVEL